MVGKGGSEREKHIGQRMSGYWAEGFERDRDAMRGDRAGGHGAGGMATGLVKKGSEEHHEDLLRSFPVVLPRLAHRAEKHAALLAGDWITQIRPMIADASARAGIWWDEVSVADCGKIPKVSPSRR